MDVSKEQTDLETGTSRRPSVPTSLSSSRAQSGQMTESSLEGRTDRLREYLDTPDGPPPLSDLQERTLEKIQGTYPVVHRDGHRCIRPTDDIFDAKDPGIKEDILRMILQYLTDEGYHTSRMTLQDEANIRLREAEEGKAEVKRLKKAILEGDWPEVDKACGKLPMFRQQKAFLYAVYRQQFLEYIDKRDHQRAFAHLTKRLKPLEHLRSTPDEFKDLAYLLTAKSVQDAPSFRDWDGIGPSREILVRKLQGMLDFDHATLSPSPSDPLFHRVPEHRLLTLLRQAVAYQEEFCRYHHPRPSPTGLSTLLADYESFVIPNTVDRTFQGHRGNVKCFTFAGLDGDKIVSGSSDNTIRIWDVMGGIKSEEEDAEEDEQEKKVVLEGHEARVWSVSADREGSYVASASSDKTVKIWSVHSTTSQAQESAQPLISSSITSPTVMSPSSITSPTGPPSPLSACLTTLTGHTADVYSVVYHPGGKHVVSGGYDKVVRFHDITTGQIIKAFTGHQLAITGCSFGPLGNLLVTGSKDNSIRFWDLSSGLCVKSITSHLGEVTSVALNTAGSLLLSSSKDNSNRLWDIRMARPVRKLKGHQNTSKNFVRASFAPNNLIVGGSEDGVVYLWDQGTGGLLQRLPGHEGVVYDVHWSRGILASASEDRTLRTWRKDPNLPVFS
ncbi:WD40-repeat-containing domain protein [Piptocephalis cylindrospora]|uniref:WD40 repeat-containing protein SMU1 n=1 Tax=Piptocephalis cylindrospora TaxID=1907219 RepID=A0A4P9Y1N7_9FUNG|nr:WD40-repeat-containing domain protein [Piptocephalis cylindrospora]|eukprot:RKP12766.1 WD40-repeat-containing domain protein [Piptocephalis cylindrospora]